VVEAAPPAVEIPAEIAADFHEQLRLARERLSAKAYDEALPYYENLIAAGQMLDQTQSDLSYILKTAPATPPVRRVLGDAYRAQGRLQEALEEYRAALDSL
jgi:tetratricopeptide (TPR) repeat protein